jgi:hypothetical protein
MAKTETKAPDTLALRSKPAKELGFSEISKQLYDAGDIVSASEYGTGFEVLDKDAKGQLVGVPFIILDWVINNEGDFGEFVSLRIVTQDNRKLIVNDGSTGIAKQIREIAEAGELRALYVKKGLRRSDYEYTEKNGAKKPATTFYLDTSA